MNARNTWLWAILAAGLLAFIFFYERNVPELQSGPIKLLPALEATNIHSIQVLPRGQLAIHAERTNGSWHLTAPLAYPAQSARIDALLALLTNLTASPFLSPEDLKKIPDAEQQFGFDFPQVSVMLDQRKHHLLVGRRTPPGDQVFVEVVGTDGVFVVDAALLDLIPITPDQWRDPALVNWNALAFDRIIATNAGKVLELQFQLATGRWRILAPWPTRADSAKVENALRALGNLNAQRFISDTPNPPLESFGLKNPELSIGFHSGTNVVLSLEFGASPTNQPDSAYARRGGENTIVTVPKAAFAPWLAAQSDSFRGFIDQHLVALTRFPQRIEIHGIDRFAIEKDAESNWRVIPDANGVSPFPADASLVAQFIAYATNIQATIVKDIVTEPDLASYGLSNPTNQYIFKAAITNGSSEVTNRVIAQVDFGVQQDKVYARRATEAFVYSVDPAALAALPAASWQMRERRLWNFSTNDVARARITRGGRVRELTRKPDGKWIITRGQGIIDPLVVAALDETMLRLGELSAAYWVGKGAAAAEAFGIPARGFQIVIELNDGTRHEVSFGKIAPSQFPYASVTIDGEPWVFEFPWTTYQLVEMYLAGPGNSP